MPLEAQLKKRIAEQGPLSIAAFMQEALLHPVYGYYCREKEPFGRGGDFITAPEISQMFGEMLGIWCAATWQQMGSPPAISLLELGPGRGTLMQDALRATAHIPGFHAALSVFMLEASPSLRRKQQQTLAASHPSISWIDRLEEVPASTPLLVLANEFFDALPIHQYVLHEGLWHEKCIRLDEKDALAFCLIPTQELSALLAHQYPEMKENNVVEHSPLSLEWITQISGRIATQQGAALIIDYGYTAPSGQPTLQAVKDHRYHPVLETMGEADITALVDFSSLKTKAEAAGVRVEAITTQGTFLHRLNIGARAEHLKQRATPTQQEAITSALERLTHRDSMGELFKVMALCHHTMPPLIGC